MPQIQDLRSFLISWNNTFPFDRAYRKLHNIAFNSPQHRATCQIDIYLEWLESEIFTEHEELMIEKFKKDELYKKGEWISESKELTDREEKLFDDIDVTQINI